MAVSEYRRNIEWGSVDRGGNAEGKESVHRSGSNVHNVRSMHAMAHSGYGVFSGHIATEHNIGGKNV